MNVYKIDDLWIAADSPESALGLYMGEKDSLDDIFIGDLAEGEEYEVTISIKRLTTKAMSVKSVPCCDDGCEKCDNLDEQIYFTYQELIDDTEKERFPRVLAYEE